MVDTRELNRGNGKYCSLSCSGRKAYSKTKGYETVCKHCGKPFKSKSVNSKYCSNLCKQKNYRIKSKFDNGLSIKTIYRHFPIKHCEICNWSETTCDLHHVLPVSKGGKNEVNNLISVCPNHHRLIHKNLISQDYLQEIVNNRTISSS